jgi:hypothetical protein
MKKITKLAFSMAVASCALIASLAVSANAATVTLEYDAANSTAQTACVSLKTDAAEISSYEVYLQADNATIESFEVVESMEGFAQNITDASMAGSALNDGVLTTVSGVNTGNGVVLEGGVIYTLKLTFAEEITEDTTISWIDYSYVETGDGDWIDSDGVTASCVIKAEEDLLPYVPTDLDLVGGAYFAEDTTSVPVAAWSTTINYSTTGVVGTLVWNITNNEGTAKVPATVVTTEGSVVYGLVIAGQAAELDTITKVQLIAE